MIRQIPLSQLLHHAAPPRVRISRTAATFARPEVVLRAPAAAGLTFTFLDRVALPDQLVLCEVQDPPGKSPFLVYPSALAEPAGRIVGAEDVAWVVFVGVAPGGLAHEDRCGNAVFVAVDAEGCVAVPFSGREAAVAAVGGAVGCDC